MIDSIDAAGVSATERGVVFCVGPLRMDARCSQRDADALCESSMPVRVFCELQIRDEQIELVAFSTEARRQLYRDCRAVSGIGLASALALLDCGEPTDVLRAAVAEEVAFFRQVPGLGPKKIGLLINALRAGRAGTLPAALPVSVVWWVSARESVIAQLGCDDGVAEAALRSAASHITPASAEELAEEAARRAARAAEGSEG